MFLAFEYFQNEKFAHRYKSISLETAGKINSGSPRNRERNGYSNYDIEEQVTLTSAGLRETDTGTSTSINNSNTSSSSSLVDHFDITAGETEGLCSSNTENGQLNETTCTSPQMNSKLIIKKKVQIIKLKNSKT